MITKEQAISLRYRQNLEHTSVKNKNGSPARCRVNGKCQTWKTRPEEFKLPVKHDLKKCFYITQDNAKDWSAVYNEIVHIETKPHGPMKTLVLFPFPVENSNGNF